ncbi:type II secretion system F family protein [Demequina mangrovi]|uniref:Tight adherence protein C n=1 Tax=Demequina mangrovi TaxID=1043493 RepID=A0A1H6XUN0_9MICO|nr:type II secretion system F family protein [Demequina mangrovi]SEJ32778.1 tight adherence protein C [Demequina mangrovi]
MTVAIALALAAGMGLVQSWVHARRFSLERRIAPRLAGGAGGRRTRSAASRIVAPLAGDAIRMVERWGPSAAELDRRLARAGSTATAAGHRTRTAVAAAAGLAIGLLLGTALAVARDAGPLAALLIAAAVTAAGAAAPDLLLVRRGHARAARIRAELPAIAEMLALAVVAGESVQASLARAATTSQGPLADELGTALAEVRAGRSVSDALDAAATRSDEPVLASFCAAIITALERGSPLAEVLHAQAADVRDRDRQALLAEGGRREIAMLVPVVLLILPVTVLFALYPGLVALRLGG